LFEKVIEKDPSFAPAYAGLAAAYASRWASLQGAPDADWVEKMHTAANKAIELDPLLPEAYRALGLVDAAERRWDQAERHFRHAIELDPSSSETYSDFAMQLLMTLGRVEEAIQQARAAVKMDPLSSRALVALAFASLSAGRYDEAAAQAGKLPANDPMKIQLTARARLGQGRTEEAIRLLEEDTSNPNKGFLGYAYARSGRRTEAVKLAAESTRPNIQALIYAGLGDKDRTLEALDRMADLSAWRVGHYLTYRELSLLRGDPRLKILRKKIALPQ
jgi:tetratricopeptide (TPR) repeat protein